MEVYISGSPFSPDVIDATPQSKTISVSRLSSKISFDEDETSRLSLKKNLFVDTSNSISNDDAGSSYGNRSTAEHSSSSVLNELFEELENSPPKKRSQSPKEKASNTFLSLNSNKKRLKLSSSLKKKSATHERSNNRSQNCDIHLNNELSRSNENIQVESDLFESSKILDVKKLVDIFKNESKRDPVSISDDIISETKISSASLNNHEELIDIENLDALFNDSCDGAGIKYAFHVHYS